LSTYVHDEQLEERKDVFGGSGRVVDLAFVRVRVSDADGFCGETTSQGRLTTRTIEEESVGDVVPRVLVVSDVVSLIGNVASAELWLSAGRLDGG
jgi:hypothetical protein